MKSCLRTKNKETSCFSLENNAASSFSRSRVVLQCLKAYCYRICFHVTWISYWFCSLLSTCSQGSVLPATSSHENNTLSLSAMIIWSSIGGAPIFQLYSPFFFSFKKCDLLLAIFMVMESIFKWKIQCS